MRSAHPCRRLPFPHPAWILGLLVLAGPSVCGPSGVRRSGERGLARWQGKAISIRTGSGLRPRPNNSGSEPRPAEPLVVPEWIATARTSPNVQVRLQALDRWVQQGRTGTVDPLMLASTIGTSEYARGRCN